MGEEPSAAASGGVRVCHGGHTHSQLQASSLGVSGVRALTLLPLWPLQLWELLGRFLMLPVSVPLELRAVATVPC